MSEQSLEQFGGVLAVPRKPRPIMIVTAVLAAALVAAGVVILVTRPHPARAANLVATLSDPGGRRATSAAFSPDNQTLAVLDSDGTTHLWDIATGRWAGSLASPQCKGSDAQVLYSPNGAMLAVAGSATGHTCLWDITTKQQVAVLTGPGSNGAAFSPNGATLAIAGSSGQIYLWDIATARQFATLTDPSDTAGTSFAGISNDVLGVAFGPGGTTLAAADNPPSVGYGSTYIWDVPARRVIATLGNLASGPYSSQTPGPESVAFGQDGTVAVGDGDAQVELWDGAAGKVIGTLTPRINVLESNPLYNNPQADVSGLLEGSQNSVGVTVALSQDGSVLAAGVDYGDGVQVWSGAGAPTHQIASLTDPGGNNSQAPQLALSPDGSLVAVVDHNGRTYLWRVR